MSKVWLTEIKAIKPGTNELRTYGGPNVPGISISDAELYCQQNGLGYCTVIGELSGIEWLKPIQSSLKEETDILEELGEKEVMIQSFDKVRQLFEMRSWIMDGRGSYPYNDDRYKEEVRYLYEEFDALRKEVWKNIKTKTFEYREKIIADYQSSLTPKSIRDSDAVEFWEWHFKELRAGKLDLIKDKENGQTMWFYNSGKLPLLRLSTQELYAIFNEKSASLKPNKLSDGVNYNLRDSVQWNADKRSEKDLHYFKLFDGAHDEDCLLDHS